ncbi:MAG: arginine repressor [Clostridia bacterium]|nr:arginine repressor [Clostridia bacterium]MBR6039052.1 arginine repressor [Clostridia bacterium]
MKPKRHAMILKLIAAENIETQEELATLLSAQGFNVTQATVSRDIKELRLIKVLTGEGKYKYATVEKAESDLQERFIRLFGNCVVSITSAGNLIVIKTMAGSAAVAAEAIDSMKWPEIAGSIAGDNTVFVAVREGKSVTDIIKKFQKMMK